MMITWQYGQFEITVSHYIKLSFCMINIFEYGKSTLLCLFCVRLTTEEPGVVFAKKQPSDDEQRFTLIRRQGIHPPAALLAAAPPPGLNIDRQWYLFDKIREFCHLNLADVTCPEPTQPQQSTAATAAAGPSREVAMASGTSKKCQKKQ